MQILVRVWFVVIQGSEPQGLEGGILCQLSRRFRGHDMDAGIVPGLFLIVKVITDTRPNVSRVLLRDRWLRLSWSLIEKVRKPCVFLHLYYY